VTKARDHGRKGWLPAFRDATLFKVAYSFGLRRNETRMLDVADLGRNPYAPEFGDYGLVHIRYGKAKKGSPPKRRSVAPSGPGRPRSWTSGSPSSGPSWGRLAVRRSGAYRDALGLDPGLDFHGLRRSYVTHLIEAGRDPLFVQFQCGHEHASTHIPLHLRLLRLPHPHPAPGLGRDPGRRPRTR
jgi:integrase